MASIVKKKFPEDAIFRKANVLEKLYWTAGILLLFVSNYFMQQHLNIVYRLLQLCAIGGVIFYRDFFKTLFTRYMLFLYAGGFILFFFMLGNHGDYLLREYTLIFFRGCFVFMLGFSACKNLRWRTAVIAGLLVGLTLVASYDVFRIITSGGIGASRGEIAAALSSDVTTLMGSGGRNVIIDKFIYHMPQLSLAFFLCFALYGISFKWRMAALCMQGVLILAIATSTWMAAYVLIIAGGICFFWYAPVFERIKKLKIPILVVGGLICFFTAYTVMTQTAVGDSNKNRERMELIKRGLGNKDMESLDQASGGRLMLMMDSWSGFEKAPFFGNGFYLMSFEVGGHSSLFDMLSYAGIFGGVTLLSIPIFWLFIARKNHKRDPSWFTTACILCILVFLVGCLINPYYLTTTILTFTIFLVGGLTCGTHYYVRRKRR